MRVIQFADLQFTVRSHPREDRGTETALADFFRFQLASECGFGVDPCQFDQTDPRHDRIPLEMSLKTGEFRIECYRTGIFLLCRPDTVMQTFPQFYADNRIVHFLAASVLFLFHAVYNIHGIFRIANHFPAERQNISYHWKAEL